MDQELVQYLDEHFGRLDQRFERIDERFDRIEQRLDNHDQRFDEVKRHTGVLVEGLRHELQLVAEGVAMHTQVQHVQEREYHEQQHRETRALIRSFMTISDSRTNNYASAWRTSSERGRIKAPACLVQLPEKSCQTPLPHGADRLPLFS